MKCPTRAACDTLPTEDAATLADWLLVPHVVADVDAYWTVVGTDPALNAAHGV
jgi:hypothetical protein